METIFEFVNTRYMVEFYKPYNELYYYDDLFDEEITINRGNSKYGFFTCEDTISKTGDEGLKLYEDNIKNIFTTVTIYTTTIKVIHNGPKVSIRYYFNEFTRKVGRKYFQKKSIFKFITYNIDTRIMYSGFINDAHKKRNVSKSVYQATHQNEPVKTLMDFIYANLIGEFFNSKEERDKCTKIKNTIIDTFYDVIPYAKNGDELYNEIIRYREIKVPDNFDVFKYYRTQPKAKEYRKYKNKYIDAFMVVNNLSGDKLKRVLHQVTNFNLMLYTWFIDFFGDEYMMSKSDMDLIKIFNSLLYTGTTRNRKFFTKTELNRVFNLSMEFIDRYEVDNFSICDHIRLKNQLQVIHPVKWKSKTYDEFVDEHDEWSKLHMGYTTGNVTRKYPEPFINLINESIFDNCYPKLLMTSDDYNQESNVQTNCVRTYIDYVQSFIISLRRGNIESTERLTIEYKIYPTQQIGEYDVNRFQTKAKRNSIPDNSWDEALKFLDDRIYSYIENGGLFLPIKETIYSGGKTTSNEVMINCDGNNIYLSWDNDNTINLTWDWDNTIIDELPY